MDKQKPKKAKNKKRTLSKEKDKGSEDSGHEKEFDSNDFGGLPDRDLKKNLGCGG